MCPRFATKDLAEVSENRNRLSVQKEITLRRATSVQGASMDFAISMVGEFMKRVEHLTASMSRGGQPPLGNECKLC
jgi:hypothetical protein